MGVASACVLLLGACARGRTAVRPPTATSADIQGLVRQALMLDAARAPAADSLYAADAVVVANARVRLGPPRFAGVGYGGRITIAAAAVTLHGTFAWAMVDYRWFNTEQRQAEAGRATFVLEQRPSGWRVIHAHSSQLLPWDR
ncbi:MAG TPA: nuclear transport factor 2 family protein [Gemmatimonadales bacterium]